MSQSIRIFTKNVIHVRLAFNVYQASNVRHTCAYEHMKNHKFAIYHMAAPTVFAVPLDATLQTIVSFAICSEEKKIFWIVDWKIMLICFHFWRFCRWAQEWIFPRSKCSVRCNNQHYETDECSYQRGWRTSQRFEPTRRRSCTRQCTRTAGVYAQSAISVSQKKISLSNSKNAFCTRIEDINHISLHHITKKNDVTVK